MDHCIELGRVGDTLDLLLDEMAQEGRCHQSGWGVLVISHDLDNVLGKCWTAFGHGSECGLALVDLFPIQNLCQMVANQREVLVHGDAV